jgi:hypothetical protein
MARGCGIVDRGSLGNLATDSTAFLIPKDADDPPACAVVEKLDARDG